MRTVEEAQHRTYTSYANITPFQREAPGEIYNKVNILFWVFDSRKEVPEQNQTKSIRQKQAGTWAPDVKSAAPNHKNNERSQKDE